MNKLYRVYDLKERKLTNSTSYKQPIGEKSEQQDNKYLALPRTDHGENKEIR